MFWVTIVGTENDAQRYEAKMNAVPKDNATANIMIKGKVYSIVKSREDVLRDENGILELGRIMAGKMGKMINGEMKLEIKYHIVRK